MPSFNERLRTRSISNDDLCASCVHLEYRPAGMSTCVHSNFEPDWEKQCDNGGQVVTCEAYVEHTDEDDSMLDELFELTCIQYEDTLSDAQTKRYVDLVNKLQAKGVEIPFGIEV